MLALTNSQVFTGEECLVDHAVILKHNYIHAICPMHALPKNIPHLSLNGAMLCPGFIDIQLNGCGGVQFSDSAEALSTATLSKMQITNQQFGCTSFLPTLITSENALISTALNTVRIWKTQQQHQVLGLHLEGPWLNQAKKGTHPTELIRPPSEELVDLLINNCDIVSLITLAPERVPPSVIQRLTKAGIILAAGHSAATYEQATAGFAAGIQGATHLYNAMSATSARSPGLVGAVLDNEDIWCGIIADGHHVDFANLRLAHRVKPKKLLLVTDATAPAGTELCQFRFAGKTIYQREGRCVDENGILSGSTLTMIQALRNAVEHMRVPLNEALRMASLYPAQALGLDNQLGRIKPGFIANLTAISNDFTVTHTLVNGHCCYQVKDH